MKYLQEILLYLVAGVLLVLMSFAAFYSPSGAWPLSLAAIVCVFIANIDRFSEISASPSSIKATLRKVDLRIEDLKDMIEISSSIQLSLLQQTGRMGALNDEEKEKYLKNVLSIMRDAKIPEEEIAKIKDQTWDRYVFFDYVYAILGGAQIPDTQGRDYEIQTRWKKLRNFDSISSPDALETFLNDVNDHELLKRKFLEAYRYYRLNRVHMDLELWAKRDETERVKVAIE